MHLLWRKADKRAKNGTSANTPLRSRLVVPLVEEFKEIFFYEHNAQTSKYFAYVVM